MTVLLYAYIDESLHSELLRNCLPFFSTDFQLKVKKFRRWQDAQLSLLGRLLLLKGISLFGEEFKNDRLVYNEYNKPSFEKTDRLRFNISHSGDITVCVISDDGDIGVDIEYIYAIDIEEFKSLMTAGEWKSIYDAANSDTAFFTWWTQKEAVIKANGKGLSIDLKSFEIADKKAAISGNNYLLKEIILDTSYICYTAIKAPDDPEMLPAIKINHIDTAAFIPAQTL